MNKIDKDLLAFGLSRADFQTLWRDARRGDPSAKTRLYEVIKVSPALQNFSRSMGKYADKQAKTFAKAQGKKKSPKDSQWTRAKNSLGADPAQIVSGGLPSLGKRS